MLDDCTVMLLLLLLLVKIAHQKQLARFAAAKCLMSGQLRDG